MRTFVEVIDAFGVTALTKILDIPDTHVRTMKVRRSIPSRYWSALLKAAPRYGVKGLTLESLHAMQSARFAQERVAS